MRKLYVHASQSIIWNLAVTARFQKYGLSVVEGDLVAVKRDVVIRDDNAKMSTFSKEFEILLVTSDDVAANKYNIFDVVLPLLGYDVKFPEHDVGRAWYESELKKLNVSFEDLGSRKNRGPFSLGGTYRHAFQRALDLDWELIRYSDVDETLSKSDVEKLRGGVVVVAKEVEEESTKMDTEEEKSRLALRIAFTLRKASYATMLLRELTKCSSQTELHMRATKKAQSDQIEKKKAMSEKKKQEEEESSSNKTDG